MRKDPRVVRVYVSFLRSRPRVALISFLMVLIAITALAGGFKPSEKTAIPVYDLRDNLLIEGEGVAYLLGGVDSREQLIEPKNFAVIQVEVTNKLDRAIYPGEIIRHSSEPGSAAVFDGKFSIQRAGKGKISRVLGPGLGADFEVEKSGERKFYLFDVQPTPEYRGFVNGTLPDEPLAEVRF